jgi:hypothetical protein
MSDERDEKRESDPEVKCDGKQLHLDIDIE